MIIKEFLPNPIGDDKEGEYILLLNGKSEISLAGWKIKDASGKEFLLKGNLGAGQGLRLTYIETKISLNNNGEKLFLYDADGNLIDELGYSGQATEGQIINKLQIANKQITDENLNLPNTFIAGNSITRSAIFLDFITSGILAAIGLYILVQLEKKLNQKLF